MSFRDLLDSPPAAQRPSAAVQAVMDAAHAQQQLLRMRGRCAVLANLLQDMAGVLATIDSDTEHASHGVPSIEDLVRMADALVTHVRANPNPVPRPDAVFFGTGLAGPGAQLPAQAVAPEAARPERDVWRCVP